MVGGAHMQCSRCLNTQEKYFYQKGDTWYCRRCIAFGRQTNTDVRVVRKRSTLVSYHLDYTLTKQQEEMSNILVQRYQQGQSTKLKAVCGAGKTEILYAVIAYALNQRARVCFAIPRRELVKELAGRITMQFKNLDYSVVYGGHDASLDGQFILCTCHQLYRFEKQFDLLILDEVDAFPYDNNDTLVQIVSRSCKGNYIHMSATMEEATLSLHTRYHNFPLPIPHVYKVPHSIALGLLIKRMYRYIKLAKPVLVYVPRREDTQRIQKWLTYFHIRAAIAHSHCDDIQETIVLLKKQDIDCIITTTILERGITIENVQVLVMYGQHPIYDRATLLQICGRVGRKISAPDGDIILFTVYRTKAIKKCIQTLQSDNAYCV